MRGVCTKDSVAFRRGLMETSDACTPATTELRQVTSDEARRVQC